MNMEKAFDSITARRFLAMAGNHLLDLSTAIDLQAHFPTTKWMKGFGGTNGDLLFSVCAFITTDKDLMLRFEQILNNFMHDEMKADHTVFDLKELRKP